MLSDDQAWFEANRPTIARQYPNQYVIVKDQAVHGAYPDYQSAYTAAVQAFGTAPFLVQKATPMADVKYNVPPQIAGRRVRIGQAIQQGVQNVADSLRESGAIVNVVISVPSDYAAQLKSQGKPVPPPQTLKGMVDTGASISTITEQAAATAGLQSVGSVPLGGVGGMSDRPIMAASLNLPDYGVTVDPIQIASVSIPGAPGFDVLVGRDTLEKLRLDYEGPQGIFSLTEGASPSGAPGSPAPSGIPTSTLLGLGVAGAVILYGALSALKVFK